MIELIALPPFIYAAIQDFKTWKVKNGIALAFELLAFIAAIIRWDFKTALIMWAFAKTVAFVMAYFHVIRAVDMPIFAGYALTVGNFIWIVLTVVIISVFALSGLLKKSKPDKKFAPLTPVLFLLFIIYYIGYLGVGYLGV